MNRQNLWARKYNLPRTMSWAIAALGLVALIFVLFAIPAYYELATRLDTTERISTAHLEDRRPFSPYWRWLVIFSYLIAMCFILLSPVLAAWPTTKADLQLPSGRDEAEDALEEDDLRRQSLISTMAAGTIHEIRSPLTAARGFVQLIGTLGPENELTKKYSEYALLEMDNIERLLQEFTLLSKAVAPKSQPVNLLDAAHNVCNIMEAVMLERNIRLEFDGAQPACILGDPFYLQKVLQHLLFNAADATPPKGRVAVRMHSGDDQVWITVSDTGVGMTKDNLEHCFDPFFSTKDSGTGLGLAICHRMVTEMHGRIEVQSEPEAGTTFRLTFPLYRKRASVEL